KYEAMHVAESRLRSEEAALKMDSQQHEVAMSMAREVASGECSILRQFEHQLEHEKAEQAAQAGRVDIVLRDAGYHINSLEELAHDSRMKAEEYSPLPSGSVSVVYTLEGETERLRQLTKDEDIAQLQHLQGEMRTYFTEMCTSKAALRSQLIVAESVFSTEQRDSSLRLQHDPIIRRILAAYTRMESVWKSELYSTKLELRQMTVGAAALSIPHVFRYL
ncbi:MAG: hypothetical protein ACKPKO_33345, partial [Candidatus Fonsibacter sp.]